MRLDLILDSVYVVGSLWGGLNGSRPCAASPSVRPAIAGAVIGSTRPKVLADVTAFIDVNVVPMDTERVLANQTVLVAGGRITALGPASQVNVPAGAVRVDGRGKYLMPGLADMHIGGSHAIHAPREGKLQGFAYGMLGRYLAQGITTVRSLSGLLSAGEIQVLRHVDQTGDFPTPRLYLARSFLRAKSLGYITKPESVATHVAEAKAAGYDLIGTYFGMKADSPDERAVFDSLVVAAHRAGLPLATHAHGQGDLPFDAILALGAVGGSVEHLPVFQDSLAPDYKVDPSKIPAYVTALKRAGVWITPTMACIWSKYDTSGGTPQVVKALQDAGVGLLLGSDDIGDLHDELTALVRAGLSPYQALVTGTRNAAQYLRVLDSTGTVAVGKWADLVLLYGNPLQDVRYAREPAGVMIKGQWLDRTTLDQRLLASPDLQTWIRSIKDTDGLGGKLKMYEGRLLALADSLDLVRSSARPAYERVLQRFAEELGAIRATLRPSRAIFDPRARFDSDDRVIFDSVVRVWLREQTRQGYTVVVAGVADTVGTPRRSR